MRKVIYPEHLGKIRGTALLEELAKATNVPSGALEKIQLACASGFAVTGEFEWTVYESSAETEPLVLGVQAGHYPAEPTFGVPYPPGKKLLRLILEVQ
jgi:hypothetical protein